MSSFVKEILTGNKPQIAKFMPIEPGYRAVEIVTRVEVPDLTFYGRSVRPRGKGLISPLPFGSGKTVRNHGL